MPPSIFTRAVCKGNGEVHFLMRGWPLPRTELGDFHDKGAINVPHALYYTDSLYCLVVSFGIGLPTMPLHYRSIRSGRVRLLHQWGKAYQISLRLHARELFSRDIIEAPHKQLPFLTHRILPVVVQSEADSYAEIWFPYGEPLRTGLIAEDWPPSEQPLRSGWPLVPSTPLGSKSRGLPQAYDPTGAVGEAHSSSHASLPTGSWSRLEEP